MKTFKVMFMLCVFISTIVFSSLKSNASDGYKSFYANVEALGFSLSRDYRPAFLWDETIESNSQEPKMLLIRKYIEVNQVKDAVLNVTTIYDMLLYNIYNPNLYCYAYKIIAEPKQERHWGFMGIGSYGEDFVQDNVKVTIDFPDGHEILSYVLENAPETWTTTLGVGLSKDGFELSASVSYNHSELNIYSRTSTYDAYYEAEYDFEESKRSEYMKHEVSLYGFIMFKSGHPNFSVQYDVKYFPINGFEKNYASVSKKNFVSVAV